MWHLETYRQVSFCGPHLLLCLHPPLQIPEGGAGSCCWQQAVKFCKGREGEARAGGGDSRKEINGLVKGVREACRVLEVSVLSVLLRSPGLFWESLPFSLVCSTFSHSYTFIQVIPGGLPPTAPPQTTLQKASASQCFMGTEFHLGKI